MKWLRIIAYGPPTLLVAVMFVTTAIRYPLETLGALVFAAWFGVFSYVFLKWCSR